MALRFGVLVTGKAQLMPFEKPQLSTQTPHELTSMSGLRTAIWVSLTERLPK